MPGGTWRDWPEDLRAACHRPIIKNVEIAQSNVLIEIKRLSAQHSEKFGTRGLDILHVAMPVTLGSERFLSFDIRQVKLAKAAGLKVPRL